MEKLKFKDIKKGDFLEHKFYDGRFYLVLEDGEFLTVQSQKTGKIIEIHSLNNYELLK